MTNELTEREKNQMMEGTTGIRISLLENRVSLLENAFRSRISALEQRISVLENESTSIKPAHEEAFAKILERTADGTTDEMHDRVEEIAKAAVDRVRAEETLIAAAAIARMRASEERAQDFKRNMRELQLLRQDAQNER